MTSSAVQVERFWSRVDKNGPTPAHRRELGPCYAWLGTVYSCGYGYMRFQGKRERAHRLAWFIAHGRWPNTCALHKCDNPLCVRIEHLFEGTQVDNNRDKSEKGRDARGERHGMARLTPAQVETIRELAGATTVSDLSRRFSVSRRQVRRIIIGTAWGEP